ncbi:MAG TPA: hypothetical protein VKF41_01095, partial [Bryobacteraceae bacterium]|nr:hypothetical protein [Bryobacteraceae bacterium]
MMDLNFIIRRRAGNEKSPQPRPCTIAIGAPRHPGGRPTCSWRAAMPEPGSTANRHFPVSSREAERLDLVAANTTPIQISKAS